jgi:hypothetical protein
MSAMSSRASWWRVTGRCANWRHLVEQYRCAVGDEVAAGAARDQVHQQPVQPVDGLGPGGDKVLATSGPERA